MDPWVRCHGMKANPTGYLWSEYECFLVSGSQDLDLELEKFNTKILFVLDELDFDL